MPKQRKRTTAVIGEPNRKLCPFDRVPPQLVFAVSYLLDESSVRPCKAFNLVLGYSVNAPLRLHGPAAQGDCYATAWLEERDQLTEGACTINWWNMHPDRT